MLQSHPTWWHMEVKNEVSSSKHLWSYNWNYWWRVLWHRQIKCPSVQLATVIMESAACRLTLQEVRQHAVRGHHLFPSPRFQSSFLMLIYFYCTLNNCYAGCLANLFFFYSSANIFISQLRPPLICVLTFVCCLIIRSPCLGVAQIVRLH